MAQSLGRVFVHVVFSTKNRFPFLADRSVREEMHAYLGGAFKALDCPVIAVGGVSDHVHVLCIFSRKHSISHVMKEVKAQSSRWVKTKGSTMGKFEWQRGYGVFSVDPEGAATVRRYIASQEDHHRRVLFMDEYRKLLVEAGAEYDERYVWD